MLHKVGEGCVLHLSTHYDPDKIKADSSTLGGRGRERVLSAQPTSWLIVYLFLQQCVASVVSSYNYGSVAPSSIPPRPVDDPHSPVVFH